MNATDATAAVFGTLISLLLFAGVYVWMALALSAVFRKSGVEPFKAWVPILNIVVLLQLAGLSPWLVLLAFVPIVNIAFLVVFAIALYRVSVAFGFGAGMTVVGVLLFPVWASIVGWGSARWVGRDASSRGPLGGGVRRASAEAPGLPPLPPFPAPASRAGEPAVFPPASPAAAGFAPAAYAPPPPAATPSAPAAADVAPPAGGWTPPPLPGRPVAPSPGVAGPVAAAPVSSAPLDSSGDEAAQAAAGALPDPWKGFVLDTTDRSAEVTGAVPGAPGPISAVPSAPAPASASASASTFAPASASGPFAAPEGSTTGEHLTRPPVMRVPAADRVPGDSVVDDSAEPWAPARSPMSEGDAFPEASGPVSAIAGAPDAGAPRSARTSVSSFHGKPEIPDEQDVLDETIIARRKRTDWTLVPPTGEPVALSAEVVILGRRPAGDPDFPAAQLVSIHDGTVSKTHARLTLRDDRWYVTDLDSTNGVLFATVMGTEVEAPAGEEVEAGDRFLLGDAEVRLRRSDG
ncbi:hypothetical protein B1729_02760 [Microbacterium sp. B35-04]|uniref:DUF5684 domain-containing protein n=1 Tax=Microbacterium sp. B35-04 TaxID=1961716 RepID=UPI0013D622F6|nr:DUF5684 domain-containing protein [Microbacterium sp. B35-04]KAF2414768.1 hypothetical protein B1729_02760 [Microbacterium sp. B35-04]